MQRHSAMALFRAFSTNVPSGATSTTKMEQWGRQTCRIIRNAHAGHFDVQELASVYSPNSVFDDPCGTLPTPAGIVAGFKAIKYILKTDILDKDSSDWTFHPHTFGGRVRGKDGRDVDVEHIPAQARLLQRAKYTLRLVPSLSYTLESTIVLTFDEEQRVVKHEDRWWDQAVTWNAFHASLKRVQGAAFVHFFA
jgi:hypothetical protein